MFQEYLRAQVSSFLFTLREQMAADDMSDGHLQTMHPDAQNMIR